MIPVYELFLFVFGVWYHWYVVYAKVVYGVRPLVIGARMQPLTRGPEASDTAASAAHPPYTRLCAAEAAEA